MDTGTDVAIRQNRFFAFAHNAAGVTRGRGRAYPFFGLTLSPAIAAAAMALSSVSVVGNSRGAKIDASSGANRRQALRWSVNE